MICLVFSFHTNINSWLDLLLEINKDGRLRVKINDKRDILNFDIVNFPFLCGNVPQSPSYRVYISQLIRYARASTLYDDSLSRSCRLTSKLISAFKKFYGRHKILVDRYKVSVTHISDLFLETLYRPWLTYYCGGLTLLCMFECISMDNI